MNKKTWISLLELGLRINVSFKLFIYGLGKIVGGQFYTKDTIPEAIARIPHGETGSYNLAWTFFGHSKGYILFIGISQLLGVFLLLFNKTKLLGAAVLIPILLNIIVVDYFYGVAYGALFSACFYLGSILFVLFLNKEAVQSAINSLLVSFTPKWTKKEKVVHIGVILGIFGLLFLIELFFINLLGYEDR